MINDLLEVMPLPARPVETGSSDDWPRIEQALGTALPQDYKDFINTYGTGNLGRFIWIFNPFSVVREINLLDQAPPVLASFQEFKSLGREDLQPYNFYPEEDSLLPWGLTFNGDYLFWQTMGHPDQWTVVAIETRGDDVDRIQHSMTGFLVGLISGKFKSKVVPRRYIDMNALFEPMNLVDKQQ